MGILLQNAIMSIWELSTMSGLGHLRRFGTPRAASGLPHSTDIARPGPLVRFVPKPEVMPTRDQGVANRRLIGIGGSLATPPLPHHRTYGSVYGGSRSYANALRSRTGD